VYVGAALAALLTCTCDEPTISIPKKPVDGICRPGATFHCACPGDDPDVQSGQQPCREDFHIGPCDCDAGADDEEDAG
jgi:hypothetical protein